MNKFLLMESMSGFYNDWNVILSDSNINTFISAYEYDFIEPYYSNFLEYLEKYNPKDLTFVLGGTKNSVCEKYKEYGEVKYWSDCIAYITSRYLNLENYSRILKPLDITIPFTFYVRKSKHFREYLYNILQKEDILKYSDYSFNNGALDNQVIYDIFDIHNNGIWHSPALHPNAYSNSFLEVTCETYNNEQEKYFFSEKTWRPIIWGKPFLIVGISGINRQLKSMGFELFEEIIDYSFDSELNVEKRMEMISKEIIKLCKSNYNLNELYYDVLYPKINHNRNLVFNNILKEKDIPQICLEVPLYSKWIQGAKENIEALRQTGQIPGLH